MRLVHASISASMRITSERTSSGCWHVYAHVRTQVSTHLLGVARIIQLFSNNTIVERTSSGCWPCPSTDHLRFHQLISATCHRCNARGVGRPWRSKSVGRGKIDPSNLMAPQQQHALSSLHIRCAAVRCCNVLDAIVVVVVCTVVVVLSSLSSASPDDDISIVVVI